MLYFCSIMLKMKNLLLRILPLMLFYPLHAQIDSLSMDLDFTSRLEADNGYSTLIPEGKKMKADVQSRARIGLNLFLDKLEIRVAAQDARTWGSTSSGNQSESVSFYEAWAKYNFSERFYVKAGRQAISFDNGRIIWESSWGMKGKTFDALRFGYQFNNGSALDLVGFYNSESTRRTDSIDYEFYGIFDGEERTKSVQLLHFESSQDNNFTYSAILMNNVVQKENGSHNSLTTAGLGLKHKFSSVFNISLNAYYQFGKNTANQKKNAYDLDLRLKYSPIPMWDITLGGEWLSGTSYDESADKNNSFSPLYGTSHSFNGYMDYFYSSNHLNGPGLIDLNLKHNFNFNRLGELLLAVHYFSAEQQFHPEYDKYLGTELDLVYGKKFGNNFLFNIGYSQIFYSDNLKVLKNVPNAKDLQNFIWVGLSFKPEFKLL